MSDESLPAKPPCDSSRGKIIRTVVVLLFIATVLGICLVEAVNAEREASRRISSACRLKQFGVALLMYVDANKKFPAVDGDQKGAPPVSWRVAILPFIGEAELYKQYHFDEPWNSEHNKTLLAQMPGTFRSPGDKVKGQSTTNFVAITGNETVWPTGKGVPLSRISDGQSKTLMVAEVTGLHIPWTEPRDLPMDDFVYKIGRPGGPQPLYPGLIQCLVCDGAVLTLPIDTPPETLRAIVTIAGRESTPLPGN